MLTGGGCSGTVMFLGDENLSNHERFMGECVIAKENASVIRLHFWSHMAHTRPTQNCRAGRRIHVLTRGQNVMRDEYLTRDFTLILDNFDLILLHAFRKETANNQRPVGQPRSLNLTTCTYILLAERSFWLL